MYTLEPLPYLYQDLEPYIDTHTMGLHYNKHQRNYLNNLNKILIKNNYNFKHPLDELIFHINEFPIEDRENLLFNIGGVINHNLYFRSINPNNTPPNGNLLNQILMQYESLENFFQKIKQASLSIKGSGYTFLVTNKKRQLQIITLPNQQTPLSMGLIPLFNIDMWEHAYYLNYKNEKEKYIDNFLSKADFKYASEIYQKL